MAVRTFNKSLFIVRKVQENPGKFSGMELANMAGSHPSLVTALINTGVLEYSNRAKVISRGKHAKTYVVVCLKLGQVGKEKLDAFGNGGNLPPVLR